jgi:MFS family permease
LSGAARWGPRAGLWRHRDFLLLWSAQGISAVGSRITRTALPMAAILVAGAGALDLGFLALTLTLPRALLAWVGGGFVDRHRRRPVLIGADIVRCVALIAIPLAAWRGALSLPLLYAIAAITGTATVLFELADHVFITDLVGREQLLEANGKREAVDAVAEITGPALGGALVAWLTAPIAIAVDAATFFVSAVLIARIRKRETIVAPAVTTSLLSDVRTGIHVVWRDPAIRALFVAASTMTLFGSFMAALYTLFALTTLGLTPTQLGITIGCGGIGAFVGAAFSGRMAERFGPRRTLLWTLAVGAAMQVLIPLAPAVPWIAMSFLIATQVIGDGVLTIYLVNETTLRQRLMPPEALGRAAATFHVANGTLTPIGALIGGVLADGIGMRPTLWLLAIGYAAAFASLVAARSALPERASRRAVLDPSEATG